MPLHTTTKNPNVVAPTATHIEGQKGQNTVPWSRVLQYLQTDIPATLRVTSSNMQSTTKLADGISRALLANFPVPGGLPWTAMDENIRNLNAGLDGIAHIFGGVSDVFEGPPDDANDDALKPEELLERRAERTELVKRICCQLLHLSFILGLWLDSDVAPEGDLPTPTATRNKAIKTLSVMLQGLGYSRFIVENPDSHEFPSSEVCLRTIFTEVNTIAERLTSTTANPMTYPLAVAFFTGDPIMEYRELSQSDMLHTIVISNPSDAFVMIATALQVLLSSPSNDIPAIPFVMEQRRILAENVKALFDYCLDPSCVCTDSGRVISLAILLEATLPVNPDTNLLFPYMQARLLQSRFQGILAQQAPVVDVLLKQSFTSRHIYPTRATVFQALSHLKTPSAQDGSVCSLAKYYLENCIQDLDKELLPVVLEQLGGQISLKPPPIPQQPKPTQQTQPLSSDTTRLNLKVHMWCRQLKQMVHELILPDAVTWMDDDFRPNETHTIRRVLDDVSDRYTRPLLHTDTQSRLKLAEKLAKLPCFLALCSGESCMSFRHAGGPALVQMYMPMIERLLEGPSAEVDPSIRQAVFSALSCILKHRNEEDPIPRSIDIIFQGLHDKDRGVRIRAGACLDSLVRVYCMNTAQARQSVLNVFVRLHGWMMNNTNTVRETVLHAISSMGKTTNQLILEHALSLLLIYLGNENMLIRSTAWTQILNLTMYHRKNPYTLITHHIDQLAPLVASRISTRLLDELCRLIDMSPSDFISLHLWRLLPQVLVRCDGVGLTTIAHHLKKPPHSLIVENSLHLNLAPIFLLPNPHEADKAVEFILGVLNKASSSMIDLAQLLPGCTTSLLTELVMTMGTEEPGSVDIAIEAIRRVEVALEAGKGNAQGANTTEFLASQMLGIISRMIDILQDVHGKKSLLAKRRIIRSLGNLAVQIGSPIHRVSSQIMATFQTTLSIPELSEITLESWYDFIVTVEPQDLGPYMSSICAAFLSSWNGLSHASRQIIVRSLQYAFSRFGDGIIDYLDDLPDLSIVDDLKPLQIHLSQLRHPLPPKETLHRLLNRCVNSNLTISKLSLEELKDWLQSGQQSYIRSLASGDAFDPLIGRILSTLYTAACRDGDGTEPLRLVAYECIGILGAVDPYRFELPTKVTDIIVSKNYTDETETVRFVLHLIENLLVDTFRSTSDIKYQTHLAYPIQELLKYCGFSSDLVNHGKAVAMKIRHRWSGLKKDVQDAITPLLEGRYTFHQHTVPVIFVPVYPTQSTYREWLQLWVTHLISKVSGEQARKIFGVFLSVIRSKDVVIARHLLPHLVLNILISGDPSDAEDIRTEIRTVLADQQGSSTDQSDKKLLSAQAIFALLDHLNRWARSIRRELSSKKVEAKRARTSVYHVEVEEQLVRLDSVLSNLDLNLMANAAFQCKAYARALMSFEQQVTTLKEQKSGKNLQSYYDTIHEIYAHLDEPDGMEGVSTMILSPSLEHQIREHESTGRWTAAQSCWEVRLQQSPDNLDFHLGLLRCLRNLGHYDTLRNHIKGVLTHNPAWKSELASFHVESSWMVGAWDDVADLVKDVKTKSPSLMIASVLLAMRTDDPQGLASALAAARSNLGAPINAAGVNGYVRSYDAVLNLHHLYELEMIQNTTKSLPPSPNRRKNSLKELSAVLSSRLDSVLPTFRNLEPILSMRRTGFSLMPGAKPDLMAEVGRSWLTSAKIARKAGHWQTAYSAMLQGRQSGAHFFFVESVRLVKASGEPLKALQELETYMKSLGLTHDSNILDLTIEDEVNTTNIKAKLHLLRARWMNESERYVDSVILETFKHATELDKRWESSHFHFGSFYDSTAKLLVNDKRALKMNMYTVRNYAKAIRYGNKYIYQTVPRFLTLWLDLGEDKESLGSDVFNKINEIVSQSIREVPASKWYTAFPQIVSRVGHKTDKVYNVLAKLIIAILQEYPNQALWLFASVIGSTKKIRNTRGHAIISKLKSTPSSNARLSELINNSMSMFEQLLALCNRTVENEKFLAMSKFFPKLRAVGATGLLIPLQESLTVNLPSTSSATSTHQPFPPDAPTFKEFSDEIEIMRSMAKPRKITILGSDGQEYMFLGKPKDDLRKDARLMDFNSIINKLLKTNSDARRRQLHIRTYGVVTLNEECGFIQWVPNTIPIRPVLIKFYDARKIKPWTPEMEVLSAAMRREKPEIAGEIFRDKFLPGFPPVFHEWFIETFPEPTVWLESRLNYGRTSAVMSMVGYILGLGDRHTENILLDVNNGDVVHVDFNCLFEKGKTLQTPERVAFRLTQNMVDGLGITGVEGIFRIACELTMDVLRENKESLMSVLDAFVHDPLVEWEDELRRRQRLIQAAAALAKARKEPKDPNKPPDPPLTTAIIAQDTLKVIKKKLEGNFTPYFPKDEQGPKTLSTKNLVQSLIEEATHHQNLAKMYPGWAPWN